MNDAEKIFQFTGSCLFLLVAPAGARGPQRSSRRISFPDAVRGSSLTNSTPLRHLEAGELGAAMRAQLLRAHLGVAAQDDDRGHRLLPLGIGTPDDRRVLDAGMAPQHVFDLGRGDVLPAGDDHLAAAAGDVEEAVLVDPAQVAGVQASRPRRRPPGRRSDPGPGSRRPGSAGGWSGGGRPEEPTCDRHRRATAWSPGRRSRSARRSGRPWRPGRVPPRAPRREPGRRRPTRRAGAAGRRPPPARRESWVATTEITVTPSPSREAATASTSKPSWTTAVVP